MFSEKLISKLWHSRQLNTGHASDITYSIRRARPLGHDTRTLANESTVIIYKNFEKLHQSSSFLLVCVHHAILLVTVASAIQKLHSAHGKLYLQTCYFSCHSILVSLSRP